MPDASSADRFVVIARDGLKLRSGAGTEFPAIRTIAEGTVVNLLSREGMWGLVDLEGDAKADGFMNPAPGGRGGTTFRPQRHH